VCRVDIFEYNLLSFDQYLENESYVSASTLLYGNDIPALFENEEVRHFILISQILAKIVLHNILPKSGEFSHARGCAPLLIYYPQKRIKVNIPKLLVDVRTCE